MKKTEKTALTAAIFAAAMYGTANAAAEPVEAGAAFTSTTTSVVGMESVADSQSGISIDAIKELNSKMSTVYGPPPSDYDYGNNYDEEDVVTRPTTVPLYGPPEYMTTKAPDEDEFENWTTTTVINTTAFNTLYGPPSVFTTTTAPDINDTTTTTDYVIAELQTNGQPVYGPAPLYGDVNADNRLDVFDMILLRERFAENNTNYSFAADVNNDMKISVADLVLLNKYLMGKIDDIRYPEREDVTTTTRTELAGVYGPPSWFTTTVEENDGITTTTTEVTFAPLYGPPSVFQ